MIDLADLHVVLRTIHIAAGALGLAVFWVALFAIKGAKTHILCGRVFVFCASAVGVTGVLSSGWAVVDPFGFGASLGWSEEVIRELATTDWRWFFPVLGLGGLSLLAYMQVGVYAVKTKDKPRAAGHWMLILTIVAFGLGGAGVAAFGIKSILETSLGIQSLLPTVLGLVAVPLAYVKWRFVGRPCPSRMDWWYQHMECMLVSGIIFHLAVAVTVAFRLKHHGLLSGYAAIIPLSLPLVIGMPATWLWVRHYKIKFGYGAPEEAEPGAAAVSGK